MESNHVRKWTKFYSNAREFCSYQIKNEVYKLDSS